MTTARDIITRSLGVRKVLGTTQTPTGPEAADALVSLNAMLKTWSAQRVMVPYINQEALTLTSGSASRTIGTSGNFNTTRPTSVMDSFVRIDNIDHPIRVIDASEYDGIATKTDSGIPEVMAYRGEYPLGILYFYPTPDAASSAASAFKLNSWKALQQFAALSTDYALPPEYEEAIVYNLARRLGRFGGGMSQEDTMIASESMQTVRSVNAPQRRSIGTDLGHMGHAYVQDILSGG